RNKKRAGLHPPFRPLIRHRPIRPPGGTGDRPDDALSGQAGSVEFHLCPPEDRRVAERLAVDHPLCRQRLGRIWQDREHVRLRRTAITGADRTREHAEESGRLAAGGAEDDSREAVLVVLEVTLATAASGIAGGGHA